MSTAFGNRKAKLALAAAMALALAVAALLLAACGGTSTTTSSASTPTSGAGSSNTLIVYGAGTLANPFNQMFAAFKKANPGVTINSHFGASGDDVKDITQLGQPVDVLGVADYSLIPNQMFSVNGKSYASWYIGFVSNQITFAYTAQSKGASQITPQNWYKVLAGAGVKIGRSNPAADPSGYQILQMLELANTYYKDPTLSASVLKNSPDSAVAETETSLLAALQSGQIDYLGIYRSDALQHNLKYLALPAQINLSDAAFAANYSTVTAPGPKGPVTGKPIIYALTIPSNAPNSALAEKFVAFVIGPEGQAIMKANGFVVVSPALASSTSAVPSSLRSLIAAWPQ